MDARLAVTVPLVCCTCPRDSLLPLVAVVVCRSAPLSVWRRSRFISLAAAALNLSPSPIGLCGFSRLPCSRDFDGCEREASTAARVRGKRILIPFEPEPLPDPRLRSPSFGCGCRSLALSCALRRYRCLGLLAIRAQPARRSPRAADARVRTLCGRGRSFSAAGSLLRAGHLDRARRCLSRARSPVLGRLDGPTIERVLAPKAPISRSRRSPGSVIVSGRLGVLLLDRHSLADDPSPSPGSGVAEPLVRFVSSALIGFALRSRRRSLLTRACLGAPASASRSAIRRLRRLPQQLRVYERWHPCGEQLLRRPGALSLPPQVGKGASRSPPTLKWPPFARTDGSRCSVH